MKRKAPSRRKLTRNAKTQFGGFRPITIRIDAAVAVTGISRTRLFELIRAREIEAVKLGSATLVVVDSLELFLTKHNSEATEAFFHGTRPVTVRIAAAIQITGISRSRLYELIRDGEIQTTKLGRATFVIVESLQRFVARLRIATVGRRQGVWRC